MPAQPPGGNWPSPISAALVAAQGVRFGAPAVDGDDVYWIEARPAEGGRSVIVRRRAGNRPEDVIAPPFDARSRVHEYGGGAYTVARGDVYFSNLSDQRLYVVTAAGRDGAPGVPVPITPAGDWFYADAVVDERRVRLIAVREDHTGPGEAVNTLVAVALDGDATAGDILVSGHDFYSTPRLSPDGAQLAWLCWRHPQMPWDGTELWLADVEAAGALANPRRIAGGDAESIYQPGWSPDGQLCFVSDRDNWWRLYRTGGKGAGGPGDEGGRAVLVDPPADAEFARPQWILGGSTWAFLDRSRMVVAYTRRGRWQLATIDVDAGTLADLPTALQPREWVVATPARAIVVAGNATTPDAVVSVDPAAGAAETIRAAAESVIEPGFLSVPDAIEFPTSGNRNAHAFYYPPRSATHATPPGARPPLIVISHGGPTTAAIEAYELKLQFWTSRGFAVVDVNYSGSSGFGRDYRRRLDGQWGIADVEDCVNIARHLVREGKADPSRLIIRGGSAGGYTTLAALAFHPGVFTAGASYYGVSDIEVLAADTHKFESRYLDSLIGPYPAAAAVYKARSPIHAVGNMRCPLILFQGLEDKVVPPNQSQMMADALRANGIPVVYLTFAGEQHGFRKAATIVRCLEEELAFYGTVFGFAAGA